MHVIPGANRAAKSWSLPVILRVHTTGVQGESKASFPIAKGLLHGAKMPSATAATLLYVLCHEGALH